MSTQRGRVIKIRCMCLLTCSRRTLQIRRCLKDLSQSFVRSPDESRVRKKTSFAGPDVQLGDLSPILPLTLFSMDALILLTSQVKVCPYMALARASLAYRAWSTVKGLKTFEVRVQILGNFTARNQRLLELQHTWSVLASIFRYVSPSWRLRASTPSSCRGKWHEMRKIT